MISAHGSHIVSCSDDGTVRVWAVGTWQQEALLQGHTSWVNGVDVSVDGRYDWLHD